MIPPWVGKWIGHPYADKGRGPAYDCWGLVRAVLTAEAGFVLPTTPTHTRMPAIA